MLELAQRVNESIGASFATRYRVGGNESWLLALVPVYEAERAGALDEERVRRAIVDRLGELVNKTCHCDPVHGTFPHIAPSQDPQRTYDDLMTLSPFFSGYTTWACRVLATLVADAYHVGARVAYDSIVQIAARVAMTVERCENLLPSDAKEQLLLELTAAITAAISGGKELQTT